MADFEQKHFGRKYAKYRKNQAIFFCSKLAGTKISSDHAKWEIGVKPYKMKFLIYLAKNLSLCNKFISKQEVLWFFSNGLLFRIFLTLDYYINHIPSSVQICFSLFWGFFLGLGPFPIKYVAITTRISKLPYQGILCSAALTVIFDRERRNNRGLKNCLVFVVSISTSS